jgi:hypothetical protein
MTGLNSNPGAQIDNSEPFPTLNETPSLKSPRRPSVEHVDPNRSRESTLQGRLRSASKNFQESNPPTGFCIATGQIAFSAPSLSDIRRGSYSSDGWSTEGQIIEKHRRASLSRRGSSQAGEQPAHASGDQVRHPSVPEGVDESEDLGVIPSSVRAGADKGPSRSTGIEMDTRVDKAKSADQRSSSDTNLSPGAIRSQRQNQTQNPNIYEFPPKHKWSESTVIFLKAFWEFFRRPVGFLVTIYGLNVVAWGGMLFLLLCNASPAMCKPTCNDINSPRRIWIEIDSQILNALFCVTGFGTIPWRFRDLYYLLQYRIQKKEIGLRRLAGINRGWFRLAGSQELPVELGPDDIETEIANVPESSIPFPITKISRAPLTGIRAPPTKMWKLDFVIWTMVWNTFLQAVLSGFMWGLNRYKRPPWSTGTFVALACIVAACGGIMAFIEGKHVKAIEGIPVSEKDQERLKRDRELGITHFNNIKDAPPKEKKVKSNKGLFKGNQKADKEVKVEKSALEEGVDQVVR